MPRLLAALVDHCNVARLARLAQRRCVCERLVAHIPADSAVVVCAGMPRSASTWQFNVVARVLRLLGHDDIGSGWIDDLPRFADHPLVIVKAHRYESPLAARADLVFTACRDPRDVLASSQRCFGHEPRVEHAVNAVTHFERWSAIADHVMRYEDLLEHGKPAVVGQIIRAILAADQAVPVHAIGDDLAGLDPQRVAAEVEALTGGSGGDYDKVSLLHARHRTDGRHGQWSQLPPEVLRGVEAQLGRWMQARGYLPRKARFDRRHPSARRAA